MDERHLLILDLDETLVHATRQPLDYAPASQVGPYAVYRRPGVQDFLASVARHYRLAVWTSSSAAYAEAIVTLLFAGASALDFVWSQRALHAAAGFRAGRVGRYQVAAQGEAAWV